jgi:uncharacterized protein
MSLSITEAQSWYQGAESAHDFDHVLRVLTLAEQIARAEGADVEIVRAAVLLHDLARPAEEANDAPDHSELAAEAARARLLAKGWSPERTDAVAHCIAAHRFRGRIQPQTLEAKILFDADKLDALGAIGVARAYAFGGAHHQRLWSQPPANAVAATRDRDDNEHTPVKEFHVKLARLRDRMYTATARRIADERHAFMVAFFERLEREVRGEA